MENKKFELHDDNLIHVTGGTDDDDWYWGYGAPPDYLNACPVCGGGVYYIPAFEEQGGSRCHCGPCGWVGRYSELAPGFIEN